MARKSKSAKRRQRIRNKAIATIDGQGGYYTDKVLPILQQVVPTGSFAKGGNFIGGKLGGIAGGYVGDSGAGRKIGSSLGKILGGGISRLVGFGDYKVVSNSLFKEGMAIKPGESVPAFGVIGHGTRIRHREFIRDVVVPSAPTEFTNTAYSINPGNTSLFPWLATVAASYQQYRFEGLVFEFKTLSSDITSGGALGSVILATDYDVLDTQYADKVHMENSQYAVSAKPSVSQIHTIECDPQASTQNLWYVRDSGSADGDSRFYDLGKFQIATQGLPGSAGTVIGELWASYDVNLFKPEIVQASTMGARVNSAGTVSKTAVLGSAPLVTGEAVTATPGAIVFNQTQDYLMVIKTTGTGASSYNLTITGATVVELVNISNTALTEQIRAWTVSAHSGDTISFNAGAWLTVTATDLRLSYYSPSLG
jgi:hypothetical protein